MPSNQIDPQANVCDSERSLGRSYSSSRTNVRTDREKQLRWTPCHFETRSVSGLDAVETDLNRGRRVLSLELVKGLFCCFEILWFPFNRYKWLETLLYVMVGVCPSITIVTMVRGTPCLQLFRNCKNSVDRSLIILSIYISSRLQHCWKKTPQSAETTFSACKVLLHGSRSQKFCALFEASSFIFTASTPVPLFVSTEGSLRFVRVGAGWRCLHQRHHLLQT